MKHSILPPSSASRRMQCPGSRELESLYPGVDSPHAREGTAAHWVALRALTNNVVTVGDKTPEGEVVTVEMIEGAALYADFLESLDPEKTAYRAFEIKLLMSDIHAEAWGTCDCLLTNFSTKTLHILDYKFGHRFISAFENWQMIYYAIGAVNIFPEKITNITCHIVQPRYYGAEGKIRSWSLTIEQLDMYKDKLRTAEKLAMNEIARLKTGDECAFCSARHACTALGDTTALIADFSASATTHELTPEKLGYELQTLFKAQKLLNARITGLSEEAENLLMRGKRVPGFLLQPGRSNQVWNQPISEVIEMGKLLGVDLAKPQEAVTPKQAIRANIPEEIVSKYSKIVSGEMKLTEDRKICLNYADIKGE